MSNTVVRETGAVISRISRVLVSAVTFSAVYYCILLRWVRQAGAVRLAAAFSMTATGRPSSAGPEPATRDGSVRGTGQMRVPLCRVCPSTNVAQRSPMTPDGCSTSTRSRCPGSMSGAWRFRSSLERSIARMSSRDDATEVWNSSWSSEIATVDRGYVR